MSNNTVNGNNRSNIIITGATEDEINAGGGNDLVISGAGDDTINGGAGRDIIISGTGDDTVNGGSGSDILITGEGDDTVNGGSGNDIILSGSGDDTVHGGSGNDLILTGSGDDVVDGGSGNDTIDSGSGDDTVYGGSGNDTITTGDGNDTAQGDGGHDLILTGAGDDTAIGNNGHDVIITGSGNDHVEGNAGNDILVTCDGNDTVDGGDGHDVILAGDGHDTVQGGSGDDVVVGGYGNDSIDGGTGWDWIHAGADDDLVSGGAGNDYINGGTGTDIAVFDGNFSDYSIAQIDTNHYEVTRLDNGEVDTVKNVEIFRFNDADVDPANPVSNNDPVATDDTVSTNEDTAVTIDVLANDSDVDADALTVTNATAVNGSVIVNADGTLSYTPNTNFNGTDTISYTIDDGNGGTDTATVTVTVNAVNDGPVAADDAVSTDEDTAVTIDVLGNDSDVDGDALSVTAATAANGTVTINADGTLDYTPNANFNGTDTISYTIDDGNGGTDTATVTITVNAVNDGPVAADDAVSTDEDVAVTINVLGNDSDVDGDSLTVTAATATNGVVTINADGTLDYTPNANFNGTDTISYTVDDGNGGTDTATVTVTVNAVNDGPVAADDAVSTDEDTAVTIDVLGNDSDVDGDVLSVTAATAANGTVTINADGTLDYTPNANFNGTDTISYTIDDGNGGTDTATVSVTVNAVNDGPVAADDAVSTDEDTAVTIDVLGNDSDVDGDALSVTAAAAANGTVTINTDGTLSYTPNANFNGTDTISYAIDDGNGGTDTATVTVTVNAVNDGPVAAVDAVSTDEDTAVTINVLGNDSDVDGDSLTVTAATATNGAVTINADGTLDYTPNANFNGTDTISYTIDDGNGGTDTATVTVTVNAVNDGPLAADDAVSTDEDTAVTIDVLGNDSDVDGDALTVTNATAVNGSVIVNADGTLSYTPNTNFNGTDTISYTIDDGNGGTDTATVTVTVNAVNDGPVAADDAVSTDEDTAVTINVLGNDSDVDGDALSVTAATASNGSVTINADGTLSYTPNANFNGTDTISYTIDDGNGGTDTATVTVTVNAVNDGPVAADDAVSTDEDTAVTIDVLGNDTDVDGDALSVTAATAANGTVTINADGTLSYTPNANFNGTDTISYTIDDGNGGTDTATVTVTVNAVNDGPVAADDAVSTDEDTAVTIDVLGNDSDVDGDSLTVTAATATNGVVTINADGTLDYTPNANFNGTDTISYTIDDGNGGTDTATVTVTVNAVNDGPVAADDAVSTDEDTAVTIDVLGNDSDVDGDALSVTAATAANGTVSINADGTLSYTPNANFNGTDTISYTIDDGNGGTDTASVTVTVNAVNDGPVAADDAVSTDEDTAVTVDVLGNDSDVDGDALSVTAATAANGTVTINADGTLSYTPNANFNGTDTISYTIDDGNGGTDTATVTVTVNAVNDGPVAADDAVSTNEDTAVTIDVLGNDSDVDGDSLTVTAATATNGVVTINADGTLSYTPNANFNGTDTISYTIDDGNGGTDTATVTVTVNAVNDGPVAADDAVSTDEDTAVTIDVLGNDSDVDGDALSVTAATAANGTVTINADGTLDYTPNANFNGTDTISYTIDDGNGGTDTATVTVTVNAVNDGPVAVDDAVSTDEDTAVTIDVLANDSDVDGDALTVTNATAVNGSVNVNADGTLSYTPNANFNGTDTISYTIDDGNGGTDTATVTVTVNALNDGPVAADDAVSTDEDTAVTIDVLGNDSDVDGDSLTVTAATATNGVVTINADGTLDYTPNANFNGTDTISYTIDDGNGGTDTATVTVTVDGQNDAPTAFNDAVDVDASGTTVLNVLANDTDPDGDVLSVTSAVADNGTVTINADGTLNYTPDENATGHDTITYVVSDGNGGSDSATVTVNRSPVVTDDMEEMIENTSIVIDALANDSDADGDTLSIVSAVADTGAVVVNGDGTLTYTPDADYVGSAVITYQVSDSQGAVTTGAVYVSVNDEGSVNTAPVAVDDQYAADAGSAGYIANILFQSGTVVDNRVLQNDSDADGDALTIIEVNGQALVGNQATVNGSQGGVFTVRNDGQVYFDASTGFEALADGEVGTTTFTYTISDGKGGEDTAVVSVEVTGQNDAVQANADQLAVDDSSGQTNFDVLSNDVALVSGDNLTVSAVDGNTANVGQAIAGSQGGQFIINADGTATFDTNGEFDYLMPGQNATTSVTYTVSGINGETATTTVTVDVAGSNTAPVANDDFATVDAGFSGVFANLVFSGGSVDDSRLTANDSDADGDALTIVEVNGQTLSSGSITIAGSNGGTFTIQSNGIASFDSGTDFDNLPPGQTGSTSVDYTISDGNGGFSTATVTLTVNAQNDPPTPVDDTASVDEDDTVVIDVLSNDTDPNGNTLSVVSAQASNGTVVVNGDGTLSYTPEADFFGTATIEYTVTDGGDTATATVTVTVNPTEDAPVAVNDLVHVNASGQTTLDVLANDYEPDGDALTVLSAVASNGSVTINADNTLSYTPDTNATGLDTIVYEMTDGSGVVSSATVTVNRIPQVADDLAYLEENTSVVIDVLANDADPEGDTLTIESASADTGSVVINGDGTLTYTPDADYVGSAVITYQVSDSLGCTNTAAVYVSVNAEGTVNTAPVAVDDQYAADAGSAGFIANILFQSGTVVDNRTLKNDSDADGDALTIIEVNGQALVGNQATVNGSQGGVFTVRNDGQVYFDASTGFEALADGEVGTTTFTYTISDGKGGEDTAVVSVEVTGQNDAVQANADQLAVDDSSGQTNFDVLSNDVALVSGDNLTVSAVDGNTANVGQAIAGSQGGQFIINADGTATFDTNGEFDYLMPGQNATTSVTYTVSGINGETATTTVTVDVAGSNTAPVANDDFATVDAGFSGVFANLVFSGGSVDDSRLTANDSDADGDALTIVEVNGQTLSSGSITIAGSNGGTFTIQSNGIASFDSGTDFDNLPPGQTGSTSVDYTISDGNGGFSTATVTLTVNAQNDPPTPVDDTASVDEDDTVVIDVLSNDTDPNGNTLSVVSAQASNGTVVVNGDGTLSYTPEADFFGTATIEYTVTDGGDTATATVTVTVNPTEDAPVAVNDLVHVNASGQTTLDVLANDYEPDGDALTVLSAVASNGSVTINADNTLSYTPDTNATGLDTIVYEMTDGSGVVSSATVTVNRIPQVADDLAYLEENTSVVIDVLANDADPEGDTLTIESASADTGSVVINGDGTLTYTPDADYAGSAVITYQVSDSLGCTNTAAVYVSVNAEGTVNTAPVAVDDQYAADAGSAGFIANILFQSGTVVDNRTLKNDSDADGDALTIIEVNGQALVGNQATVNGSQGGVFTVRNDGQVYFDASTGFEALADGEVGTTTFTYTISDGKGGEDTAVVSVEVTGQNDAVQANADQLAVDDSSGQTNFDVLSNDVALVSGDNLTVSAVDGNTANVGQAIAGSQGGQFIINADGTATFDTNGEFGFLDPGESQTTSVTYTVTGINGESASTTVSIDVQGANSLPVANDDFVTVDAGSDGVIANLVFTGGAIVDNRLTANDTDADGDTLTIVDVNGQALSNGSITIAGSNGGSFTILSNGTASLDTGSDFDALAVGESATTTIDYTITDGKGGFSTATLEVTVDGVEDAPVANDDAASVDEFGSITLDLLANDSDPEGQSISITNLDLSSLQGTVVDNGDGTVTYDTNGQFDALNDSETADEWFEYTITDGAGGYDTAQVHITVNGSTSGSSSSSSTTSTSADDGTTGTGDNDFGS